MKKVYITKSAFKNIIRNVKISDYKYEKLPEYENLKSILSKKEQYQLIKYSSILENFENLKKYMKDEKSYSNDPKKRWIYYREKPPSYHLTPKCTHLTSNYENYSIPVEIENEDIERYREFFLENEKDYMEKRDVFFAKVGIKFNVRIRNIKEIINENSGTVGTKNYIVENPDITLTRINNLIEEMENYRVSDPDNEELIKNIGFGTDRARYVDSDNNYVLYISDKNSPIYHWHQFKNRLKFLIENYFVSTLNPEFCFEQKILDQCGLSCCRTCEMKHNAETHVEEDHMHY